MIAWGMKGSGEAGVPINVILKENWRILKSDFNRQVREGDRFWEGRIIGTKPRSRCVWEQLGDLLEWGPRLQHF